MDGGRVGLFSFPPNNRANGKHIIPRKKLPILFKKSLRSIIRSSIFVSLYLPNARDLCLAELTFPVDNIVLKDPVSDPLDQKLVVVRAEGAVVEVAI